MSEAPSDYQSSDTAWRYQYHIAEYEQQINMFKIGIERAEQKLKWLKAHPPLTDFFNWSA